MTPSTTAPNPNNEAPDYLQPVRYQYDLRLEIGVKDVSETVPVVAIFRDLIKRMKAAADDNDLVAHTARDQEYSETKEMTSEEFQKAFSVDKIEGKTTKVMLGFKIKSTTKLSDLKSRLIHSYLKPHNLFLREHAGGFENGVKTYSYGYLKYDHPDHPDRSTLKQRFARRMSDAWKQLEKEDRKKWRSELPDIFFGTTGIMLPLTFTKERLTAGTEGKEKIMTTGLVVSTPAKYGRFAKILLDAALFNKKINNLIPFALAKENPEGYYYLTAEQARFIENHRNIPITQIPLEASTILGNKGKSLLDLLQVNPSIQRVSYDSYQNKYHVSTTANKYKEVHSWIDAMLKDHQFPYGPQIRSMKYATHSYATVFQDAMSTATATYEAGSIKAIKSNPWRTRPPLDISYIPTDTAFPPLPPKKPTQATASTTTETLDEDTIQSAISSAIKKLEEKHQAEMKQMKLEFQARFAAVENQMKELGEQVVVQTYQALIKDSSPLATKTDQELLRQDVSLIQTQLATLIDMIQGTNRVSPDALSNRGPPPRTPPQKDTSIPKRPRPNRTPPKMQSFDEVFTQDISTSSATSTPEEEMEGCEY